MIRRPPRSTLFPYTTLFRSVLERFRPGQAAVFGDVADEEGRNVLALGCKEQLRGRFALLADAAWRRLKLQREDRLNRIDNDERGFDPGNFLEDAFQTRFGEQIERRPADRQALPARLDLVLRFFARAVQHGTDRSGHVRGGLQEQRRLADARFAAEKDQRSRYDPSPKHAVALADARRETRVRFDIDVRVQPRGAYRAGERVAMSGGSGGAG